MRKFSLTLFSLVLLFSGIPSAAQSRIAIPSYQDPGSGQWDGWRALGSSSVGIMIVNLNNGDDANYYPSVDQAIRNTRKKGIFVVGYVYTGYGQRNPAIVRAKVDAVFRNYLVDGIFFDEVPTDCTAANSFAGSNYSYYQDLADHVRRNQAGGRIVILNPGTQPNDDCWMSITNILVTAESSSLQDYIQNYQEEAWFHRYPPDRFWHIVYAVPSAVQMNEVIALSLKRGASWVYVTDRDDGNPYDQPPSYWSLEGTQVATQGVQAPYASFRPRSSDNNGNLLPGQVSFRWGAVSGTKWQIFLDTDRNASTGYHGSGSGLAIGADYLIEATANGNARLLRYTGSGSDWSWHEVPAHARIMFLDAGVNLIELNANALGQTHALDYQIRSLDANGTTLFTSLPVPLSLDSTAYAFDIEDHSLE
ncbi:MAG: spherulation-specific family 4 protein [Candidatus Sulfotelmatobacter sp.]